MIKYMVTMKMLRNTITLDTKGSGDLVDITTRISQLLENAAVKNGNLTLFVIGSTAAITTFEYEPGLAKDVGDLCEKLIPRRNHYCHDDTWGDANGFSHLRAMLLGPSLVIPFEDGRLLLGTWQQVVLAEFDTRPRKRKIIVHIIGE